MAAIIVTKTDINEIWMPFSLIIIISRYRWQRKEKREGNFNSQGHILVKAFSRYAINLLVQSKGNNSTFINKNTPCMRVCLKVCKIHKETSLQHVTISVPVYLRGLKSIRNGIQNTTCMYVCKVQSRNALQLAVLSRESLVTNSMLLG